MYCRRCRMQLLEQLAHRIVVGGSGLLLLHHLLHNSCQYIDPAMLPQMVSIHLLDWQFISMLVNIDRR